MIVLINERFVCLLLIYVTVWNLPWSTQVKCDFYLLYSSNICFLLYVLVVYLFNLSFDYKYLTTTTSSDLTERLLKSSSRPEDGGAAPKLVVMAFRSNANHVECIMNHLVCMLQSDAKRFGAVTMSQSG